MKESNFSRLFDDSEVDEVNLVNAEIDAEEDGQKNLEVGTGDKADQVTDDDVKHEVYGKMGNINKIEE